MYEIAVLQSTSPEFKEYISVGLLRFN